MNSKRLILHPFPSSPLPARRLANAVVEVAKQAADDVPAIAAANFDIALKIDPYEATLRQAGRLQLLGSDFVGAENLHQLPTGHLDEFHKRTIRDRSELIAPLLLTTVIAAA